MFKNGLCLLTAIFALVLISLHANTVNGMSQCGQSLPEPMRSSEIQTIADVVNMTELQRRELTKLHEQYRKLISTEVSLWLDIGKTDEGNTKEKFRSLSLARRDFLQNADTRFFSRVRKFLDDSQFANFDRQCRYRQRQLVRMFNDSIGTELLRWDVCDYPSLIKSEDVPLIVQKEFFSILDAYDVEYTRNQTKLSKLALNINEEIEIELQFEAQKYEEIKRTIEDESIKDREYERLEEESNKLYYSMIQPFTKAVSKHRRSTWNTLQSLCMMLPVDTAMQIKSDYIKRSCVLASRIANKQTRCIQSIDILLEFDGLQNENRLKLKELNDLIIDEFDLILDQAIRFTDSNIGVALFGLYAPQHELSAYVTKYRALYGRAEELKSNCLKECYELLPTGISEEQWNQVVSAPLQTELSREKRKSLKRIDKNQHFFSDLILPQILNSHHLLSVINQFDAGQLASSECAAEVIHKFNEQIESRFIPKLKKLNELSENLILGDQKQRAMDMRNLRSQAFKALEQVESALFVSLKMCSVNEKVLISLQHLKSLRDRQRYANKRLLLNSRYLTYFDVVELLTLTHQTLLSDERVQQTLREFEERSYNLLYQQDAAFIAILLGSSESGDTSAGYPEILKLQQQLISLNREVLDEVLLICSNETQVCNDLLIAAYPSVYKDSSALHEVFWEQLLNLENVRSDVLVELSRLSGNYRIEYDQLTEELLVRLKDIDCREQEIEKIAKLQLLTNDRIELSERTLLAVKQLVSLEQLK